MALLDYKTDVVDKWYAVLATDSAGAAVRAALGSGASSIIPADDLEVGSLPARPLLAYRAGSVIGSPGWDVQRATLTWWLYDDVLYKYARINALIALIQAAYPADTLVIPFCEHRQLAITAERPDTTLGNRPARAIPYQVSWR